MNCEHIPPNTIIYIVLVLFLLSCQEKDVIPEEPLGQIRLSLIANQDIINKSFDLKVITEDGEVSKTFSSLVEPPPFIGMEDGMYQVSIISQNQEFQNFGDLVFSGTSDLFNISRSDTIDVSIELTFDLPPGQARISLSGIDTKNKLFSLITLNSDSISVSSNADQLQVPNYIALNDGIYQFAIQSNLRKYQTVEDIVFSGYTEQFEISKGDTIDVNLELSLEPIRGWISVTNVPLSKRFGVSSFMIGDNIYLGFGSNYNNDRFQDWWVYSVAENTWSQLSDFPGGKRFGALSFNIGTKGYICLGYNEVSSSLLEMWEFDSETEIWTQRDDVPGLVRSSPTAFVTGEKAYVGSGGFAGTTALNDFHAFNSMDNSWSPIPDFTGSATAGFTSFSIGETGHLMCGVINNIEYTDRHIVYNSITETWDELAPFPGGKRGDGIAFTIAEKGYFGLGSNNIVNPSTDLWVYDPGTEVWQEVEPFVGPPRFDAAYGSNGSIGYYGFGNNQDAFKDLYLYYPDK